MKIDASRVGQGTGLLQTREGTSCPRDVAPDDSTLRTITVVIKGLSASELRHSNIEREALGIPHGLFCQGGKYNNQP